jgi:hypothetical protein
MAGGAALVARTFGRAQGVPVAWSHDGAYGNGEPQSVAMGSICGTRIRARPSGREVTSSRTEWSVRWFRTERRPKADVEEKPPKKRDTEERAPKVEPSP